MTDPNQNNDGSDVEGAHAHGDRPVYDDVNIPVVVMVGIISAIVTFLIVCLVQGMYGHWKKSLVEQRQINAIDTDVVERIELQKSELEANEAGRISIDDAMAKALEEFR